MNNNRTAIFCSIIALSLGISPSLYATDTPVAPEDSPKNQATPPDSVKDNIHHVIELSKKLEAVLSTVQDKKSANLAAPQSTQIMKEMQQCLNRMETLKQNQQDLGDAIIEKEELQFIKISTAISEEFIRIMDKKYFQSEKLRTALSPNNIPVHQ